MALRERLSIIQGPPGTGKTLVLSAIVANWMKDPDPPKILICAPSNTAADFIAERLALLPIL
jgi:Rad3-related DNA helicase